MKAEKCHVGILSLVVFMSCMAETAAVDGVAPKKIYTRFDENGKEAYTSFETSFERGNRVYSVQEHLVGKPEGVDQLNDRITFLFSGTVKTYVSHMFWGTNPLGKHPVMLKYDVEKLSVTIDWTDAERDSWPVGDMDATSAFQKLTEIEASQKTARMAIRAIQPVFDETGGLVSLKGKLLAILE